MPRFRKLVKQSKSVLKLALRSSAQKYANRANRQNPGRWGLIEHPEKGLVLHGVALSDLVKEWGSPLHVVDAQALRENVRSYSSVPDSSASGCEIYYSYKSNPVPGVLSLMQELGVGAEVISHYELWLARRLGLPPERIIYNGSGKTTEAIREAVGLGLQLININHIEEIDRIASIAHALGKRPRVGLRIATDEWSGQFGVPVAEGAAMAACAKARATGVLDVVGLHAHPGGMIRSKEVLLKAVDAVLAVAREIEEELKFSFEILDFGGSLATPTVRNITYRDRRLGQAFHREPPEPNAGHALRIEDYVDCLVGRVSESYRQRGLRVPRIFIEPGRSMTGDTQMLVASVITTKQTREGDYLILDAGINLAESVRSEYHYMFAVRRSSSRERIYTVVGPLPTPADTLYPAWCGPVLSEGDHVVIMDTGAYFVPFSTSFSFPRPPIVLLDHGKSTLLRRAERFEDLIAYDQLAGGLGHDGFGAE